jgi:hypothetical protein
MWGITTVLRNNIADKNNLHCDIVKLLSFCLVSTAYQAIAHIRKTCLVDDGLPA